MSLIRALISVALLIVGISILKPELLDLQAQEDSIVGQIAEFLSLDSGAANTARVAKANAVLDLGDTGATVTKIQNQLKQLGLYSGPADGAFGVGTEQAVKRFQRQEGLTVDGKAGQSTQARLNQAAQTATTGTTTPTTTTSTSTSSTAVRALW